MNNLIIQHNIASMNVQRHLQINSKNAMKSTEKLSSGYKINRAADDAASLTISEKLRKQIRGLKQGTQNAEDGISYVQTADGSMEEITEMVQRMKELTIKSLNGTNTAGDRKAMEAEFNELQSEIDRITKGTEFNTLDVFEQHEDTFYSIRGNRRWSHSQEHFVENGGEDFSITIEGQNGAPDTTYEIKVPLGTYSTQELIDEIEDAFAEQLPNMPGFQMEFDLNGYCNFTYENGEDVKRVGGSLSYLIYDSYSGGGFGSLLGTTQIKLPYPLEITPYNNKIQFTLEDIQGNNPRDFSLVVDNGNYTRKEMIDYLNQKLSAMGITEITAKEYGADCIQLGGDEHFITGLKGNMFEIDGGHYNSIFYDNVKSGTVTNSKGTLDSKAFLTTDPTDTAHNRFVIDSTNKNLKIKVNGSAGSPYVSIDLPEGSYTASQMAAAMNNAFTANGLDAKVQVKSSGQFQYLSLQSNVSGNGSSIDVAPSSSCYGTLFTKTEYFYNNSIAPTKGHYTTVEPSFKSSNSFSPITITAPDNSLKVNVDGSEFTLTLTPNTYNTLDDLITEINNQIPAGFNTIHAVKDGNSLKFTTTRADNGVNSISVSNASPSGNLYKDLFTSTSQVLNHFNGTANGTGSFQFPETQGANITISGNNQLSFYINGTRREVTVADGTYTQSDFAKLIQNQLKGSSVTTSKNVNVSDRGVSEIIEGTTAIDPDKTRPAKIRFEMNDVTKIDSATNEFKLNVNGTMQTVTLSNGTYTKQQLAQELNLQMKNAGIGAVASIEGNQLCFTTVNKGHNSSLSLSSATGGSAMQALSKKTTTTVPGVNVSFANNKLTLSGTTSGQTIQAGTNIGGSMLGMLVGYHPQENPPTQVSRQTSSSVSNIDGVNLTEPINITHENKRVKFDYTHNGTNYSIDFQLAEKNYTFSELQQALQGQIDTATAGSLLKVNVDRNGVKIAAPTYGSQYVLSNFSEGFHQFVISGSKVISTTGIPKRTDGKQIVDEPFIMGRQDVNAKPVTIRDANDPKGANNTLKIDLTYFDPLTGTSSPTTFDLTLTAGTYQGKRLAAEIQKQLDKQLVAKGFRAGMIKADIGNISSGIVGSNDKNCLNFSIPKDVHNIAAGSYTIDGVRGNAAYYTFYKTLGDPIPAYTIGSRDISKGVTIPANKNVFSMEVDGVEYNYTFPPGEYTAKDFLDLFNDKLAQGDDTGQISNVIAAMTDKNLRLSYSKMGDHSINVTSGSARGQVFFNETGRIDAETGKTLLIGAQASDTMTLDTLRLNTSFLGINSICISGEKYATKALGRLDTALGMVTEARSLYGAKQNRLAHAVNGNNNTTENLTASESRMRDTDIAKEIVTFTKSNILTQFTQSILAQANQLPTQALALLQE